MRRRSFAVVAALLACVCLCDNALAQKKGGGGNGGGGTDGPSAAETNPAIAFVANPSRYGNGSYVVVASADLSSEIRLNNLADEQILSYGPSWSPDGTKIAFWESDSRGASARNRLMVVNPDGTGLRVVRSFDPYIGVYHHGEWSPSGRELIFVATGFPLPLATYAIDIQTGTMRPLGPETVFTLSPDLNPDVLGHEHYIAFRSYDLGDSDIFLAPLELDADEMVKPFLDLSDLSNVELFRTFPDDAGGSPLCWSPNGNWLVYDVPSGDEHAVFMEHVVTHDRVYLSNYNGGREATMSSDGSYLVYRDWGPKGYDLMIVPTNESPAEANYTATRNVSEHYPAWNPVWDPSGDGAF